MMSLFILMITVHRREFISLNDVLQYTMLYFQVKTLSKLLLKHNDETLRVALIMCNDKINC